MSKLLDIVASWPILLLVLLVFGFAPGFCLRLIVLAYPRNDPRRAELIAELYAVPRVQRPLWVGEQLEVALFEGLAHRVSAALRRLSSRGRTRRRVPQRDVPWPWWVLLPTGIAGAVNILLPAANMWVVVVLTSGAVIITTMALIGVEERRHRKRHVKRRSNSKE